MRIALFSGNYNYVREGANQALNRLVNYLERSGHPVRVYSPVGPVPAFEPEGTLVPVPSVTLPVRNEFRLALGLNRALREDLRAFDPDLVHLSAPDILGTRAQSFARRLGRPVVTSMHTRFETYLDYYRLAWLKPAVEAHLHRFYRRSDAVLVPTAALVEEFERELRVPARLWSRGVDTALFSPTRRSGSFRRCHGLAEQDMVVLFFGRLVLEKGVDVFVDVVRRLVDRGHRVRPLVVGAGPAADRFRSLPGVVMTGHLDGPALADAVAAADVMISPSTTEAFGNVVLEAMASGVAIVSADTPSGRALLGDSVRGLLVPPRDPAGYADAAERLILSPPERARLGAHARAASLDYSWDAASSAVERAYLDTIRSHCRKAARHDSFQAETKAPPRGGATMFASLYRRYLVLVASIYVYNEHRGYTAIDRVLDAVRARSPDDHDLIAAIESHRADERKHYVMFRRWFEARGEMPFAIDRTCGHIDRFVEIMFRRRIDRLDTQAVIDDDRLFEKLCRVIALTERRGYRQLDILLRHPLIRSDRRLVRIFRIIQEDEPSHWAPYEDWLSRHGKRSPKWWERAIDGFIHSELLFLKLPILFLRPGLERRSDWPDSEGRAPATAPAPASSLAGGRFRPVMNLARTVGTVFLYVAMAGLLEA